MFTQSSEAGHSLQLMLNVMVIEPEHLVNDVPDVVPLAHGPHTVLLLLLTATHNADVIITGKTIISETTKDKALLLSNGWFDYRVLILSTQSV